MQAFIHWAKTSWIHVLMVDVQWSWATAEICHFIGMSLLFGAMLMVDLRLLGCFRSIGFATIRKLLPWAVAGFAINLISGSLFFLSNPGQYLENWGFRLKLVLIVLAGINALWFQWQLAAKMDTWSAHEDTPRLAKAIALLSISVWTGVLLLGRLLPYLGTGVGTG